MPLLSERNTKFGCAPGRCERRLDVIHSAAVVEADDGVEDDLLQRRRSPESREWRVGRDDEHVRVAQELHGLVRAALDRKRPEGEVEVAPLDHLEQLALVRRLAKHDLDEGMALREAAQEAWDHLRTDALERADSQASRVARLERAHVRLRREQPRLDRLRMAQQNAPRFGEGDGARAARPLDQAEPDDALECGDLLRNSRLRVAESLGGLSERALVGDRLEGDEVTEVEPEPAIRLHDRRLASQQ